MADPFPNDPADLTCADLTRLVRSLHPGCEVVDFSVVDHKTFAAGTDEVSTAGRLHLEVEVSGEGADALDRRWMVKVCRPDLGDIPLYENEVSFYTKLRPEIEIEAPVCFGGLYTPGEAGFGIALATYLPVVQYLEAPSSFALALPLTALLYGRMALASLWGQLTGRQRAWRADSEVDLTGE